MDGLPCNDLARLTSDEVPAFFTGEGPVGGGFYYLQFPNGTPFDQSAAL